MVRTRAEGGVWPEWWYGGVGGYYAGGEPVVMYMTYYKTGTDQRHTDFEVQVKAPTGAAITSVRLWFIDTHDPAAEPATTGPSTENLERDISAAALAAVPPQLTIIPCSEWWGHLDPAEITAPRRRAADRDRAITITHAILHHTFNTPPPDFDAAEARMRSIWAHHALPPTDAFPGRRNWGDIGYNFVIDPFGNIFQGTYNTNLSARDVQGIHAGDVAINSRSVGIALIGQFCPDWPDPEPGSPSDEALRSLERLLSWRFHQRSLDPRGSAVIPVAIQIGNNPDRSERNRLEDRVIPRIAGHRDVDRTTWDGEKVIPEVADTSCPGNNLNNLLPTIKANVRRPWLHVSPATISASLLVGSGWTTIGTVRVTNPGWRTLNWSATDNRAWLRVTPVSGTATTETDSVAVQATTSGLGVGRHTGTITFTGASPALGTPATVAVDLTIATRFLGLQPEGVEKPQ